jgi:hypothetical protein
MDKDKALQELSEILDSIPADKMEKFIDIIRKMAEYIGSANI